MIKKRIGLLFAAIASICVCSPFAVANTDWQGMPGIAGDWFDPANWSNGVPNDGGLTAYIDNGGVARISAGSASSTDVYLGYDNSGRLILDAGQLESRYGLSLGFSATSHGTLEINGGTFRSQSLAIGMGVGTGTVDQIGGGADVSYITLGGSDWQTFGQPEDFGKGEYSLIGGRLTATQLVVGNAGVGTFRQKGGVAVAAQLKVGGAVGAPTFTLGPVVTLIPALQPVWFNGQSPTDLAQTVNSTAVSTDIAYFQPTPSVGLYELAGGSLLSNQVVIDHTGTFRQTGGSHQTNYVDVYSDGRYELLGGLLNISTGLNVDGTFDFGHTSTKLSAGNAILNFSQGLVGAEHARIQAGPDSLTIFPAGFHPSKDLGSYVTQGITHFAGTDLLVRAEKTIRGAGHIDDFVIAAGTIEAADNESITLNGDIEVRSGAHVDLGGGSVYIKDLRTVIRGGSLTAGNFDITGSIHYFPATESQGPNGSILTFHPPLVSPGLARQMDGSVQPNTLNVETGAYALSGGSIKTNALSIGPVQQTYLGAGNSAIFAQTGGEVRADCVSILATQYVPFPLFANGNVVPNSVTGKIFSDGGDTLLAGIPPDASHLSYASAYVLSGGSLKAQQIEITSWSDGSVSRFVQSGGQVAASSGVSLSGRSASYTLLGGSLQTRRVDVGYGYTFQYFPPDPPDATFSMRDKSAEIKIAGELLLGVGSHFDAVPGTTIHFTKVEPLTDWPELAGDRFAIYSSNSDELGGLHNLKLVFEGGLDATATLEVAGQDLGPENGGFRHNFALNTLQVGGVDAARLSLVDLIDNQSNGDANEAVYVDHLIVRPGSVLDLGNIHLYYHTLNIGAGASVNGDMLAVAAIPEPRTAALACLATFAIAISTNRRRHS
jgi:hypothetical protein